jgi:F0F1-type ATP synthase alpha subunit
VELLKQGQYVPLPVEKQIVMIYLGTNGFLDELPVEKVQQFEKGIPADARPEAQSAPDDHRGEEGPVG